MARAQLEMLRDLVDLDGGVDPDLAPHPDDGLDHLVIFRLEAAVVWILNLTGFSGE